MDQQIRQYLAEIGRRGGKKSRRLLSKKEARSMVLVREAKRAYRRYHSQCFWSYDPNYHITKNDVAWVAQMLRKHGNRTTWDVASYLCR